MVILKDANLEEACKAAAFGAMQHQGQICMQVEFLFNLGAFTDCSF
jgi:acyl-CoA reductase-like NAD-dependent aldehyde dehydrogenase